MSIQVLAHIAGLKPGKLFMKFVNLHIYENQLREVMEQLKHVPEPTQLLPKFSIHEDIKTFDDLMTCPITAFKVEDYHPQPFIKFPFSV